MQERKQIWIANPEQEMPDTGWGPRFLHPGRIGILSMRRNRFLL